MSVCYGSLVHSGHPLCKGFLHSRSIFIEQSLFASAVQGHSSADSEEADKMASVRLAIVLKVTSTPVASSAFKTSWTEQRHQSQIEKQEGSSMRSNLLSNSPLGCSLGLEDYACQALKVYTSTKRLRCAQCSHSPLSRLRCACR